MNEEYKSHIEKLGFKATDKVTGLTGVIDSVCFDAYGCVQFCLRPPANKDGVIPDSGWFDVVRLDIDETERVVALPDFKAGYVAKGLKGPASKPIR